MSRLLKQVRVTIRNEEDLRLFFREWFMYFWSPVAILSEFKDQVYALYKTCMQPVEVLLNGKYPNNSLEKQYFVMEDFTCVFEAMLNTVLCNTHKRPVRVRVNLLEDPDGDNPDDAYYIVEGELKSGVKFGMEFAPGEHFGVTLYLELNSDDDIHLYTNFRRSLDTHWVPHVWYGCEDDYELCDHFRQRMGEKTKACITIPHFKKECAEDDTDSTTHPH